MTNLVQKPGVPKHANTARAGTFLIKGQYQEEQRVSAVEDRLIPVRGPLGVTVVEIKAGKARIVSSPCPDPHWHQGWISRAGEFRVCIPNQVVIRTFSEGMQIEDPYQLDGITR
ncbi:hypothetical protein SY88_07880 [Clostridiales bacterium PH28_bin88]|nr:hypothetical protein SY88_07880 [Clostridiales bacterium PH28_bin88]